MVLSLGLVEYAVQENSWIGQCVWCGFKKRLAHHKFYTANRKWYFVFPNPCPTPPWPNHSCTGGMVISWYAPLALPKAAISSSRRLKKSYWYSLTSFIHCSAPFFYTVLESRKRWILKFKFMNVKITQTESSNLLIYWLQLLFFFHFRDNKL